MSHVDMEAPNVQVSERVPTSEERVVKPRAVLMITRDDIFPSDHGAAVKIDRTAQGLSRLVNEVCVVTHNRDRYFIYRDGVAIEARYPRWLARLGPPTWKLLPRVMSHGLPSAEAWMYSPLWDWGMILRALWTARHHGARVYHAEFPIYARPCVWCRKILGGKVILVEHNVEYARIRDLYPEVGDKAYEFFRAAELDLCNHADSVVTVSARDRDLLMADGADPSKIRVIPHGVDLDRFDHAEHLDVLAHLGIPEDRPVLVYHGIYDYAPNLEAMEVMASEVLPILNARGFRPLVMAVGRIDPPAPRLHEDIHFTGSVDRVEPWILGADLAVVPLQKGGGTRMKILDYFAAGIPVVATAKGAEGIPVEPGKHLLIENDSERFAEAVAGLLADRDRATELGRHGRKFVEKLDWKIIAKQYLELMT